jgi:hypothetical protein
MGMISSGVKRPGQKAETHLHIMPKKRMAGAVLPLCSWRSECFEQLNIQLMLKIQIIVYDKNKLKDFEQDENISEFAANSDTRGTNSSYRSGTLTSLLRVI